MHDFGEKKRIARKNIWNIIASSHPKGRNIHMHVLCQNILLWDYFYFLHVNEITFVFTYLKTLQKLKPWQL